MHGGSMVDPSISDYTSGNALPWYRQPETFIAIAALIVSISAVVVGVYEAALQRAHDRAEVWPHIEISTFTSSSGASVYLMNNGIGPAVIKSILVTVDGKPQHRWHDVLQQFLGAEPTNFSVTTVADRGLRAGDRLELVGLPLQSMPSEFWRDTFWQTVGRIGVTVCYASVFNEYWEVTNAKLGAPSKWKDVKSCPAQPDSVEF
jgi:hypothetical protein